MRAYHWYDPIKWSSANICQNPDDNKFFAYKPATIIMPHGEQIWRGIQDSYATWKYVDADRQLHTLNERLCTLVVRGIYDVFTNNLRVYLQLLCFSQ